MTIHSSATLQLKKSRCLTLISTIREQLDQMAKASKHEWYLLNLSDVIELRLMLKDLSLSIQSARLKGEWHQLFIAYTDKMFHEISKELTPEEIDFYVSEFGPFPQWREDEDEESRISSNLDRTICGRAIQLSDYLSKLANDLADKVARDDAGKQPPGGGATQKTWNPPPGYVGVKNVMYDSRFKKNGKNPPRTTIDQWVQCDKKLGESVKILQAPDTGENHYLEQWVVGHIVQWNPRQPRTPVRNKST